MKMLTSATDGEFRLLREEVRRQRALELLGRGEAIREVARACGFAELSPFYRAFRRWYGSTPQAVGQRARHDQAHPLP